MKVGRLYKCEFYHRDGNVAFNDSTFFMRVQVTHKGGKKMKRENLIYHN